MRYSYYDTALSHISLDSALYCIILTTVPHSTQLELALSWIMLITVQDSTQLVLALSWIIPSTVPDSTQLDLVLSWIIISTIPDSTESFVIKLHYCMLLYCILYNITGTLYTVKKTRLTVYRCIHFCPWKARFLQRFWYLLGRCRSSSWWPPLESAWRL